MYDPMVAKLIVWDADREQATRRMLRALGEYEIEGLKTLIPFHKALLATEQWAQRRDLPRPRRGQGVAQGARRSRRRAGRRPTATRTRRSSSDYTVEVSRPALRRQGHRPAAGGGDGAAPAARRPARRPPRRERGRARSAGGGGGGDALVSPLQGNMWKVLVEQGARRSRRASSSASSRR